MLLICYGYINGFETGKVERRGSKGGGVEWRMRGTRVAREASPRKAVRGVGVGTGRLEKAGTGDEGY